MHGIYIFNSRGGVMMLFQVPGGFFCFYFSWTPPQLKAERGAPGKPHTARCYVLPGAQKHRRGNASGPLAVQTCKGAMRKTSN